MHLNLTKYIRFSDKDILSPDTTRWTKQTALAFIRVLLGTAAGMHNYTTRKHPELTLIAETLAFHGGITVTCHLLMSLMSKFRTWIPANETSHSSIRKEFRYELNIHHFP